MKLTANDYYSISEQITEDNGSVEYSKNGETLFFDYTLNVDGYMEDDYFNGTGAFIETSKELNVQDRARRTNRQRLQRNQFIRINLRERSEHNGNKGTAIKNNAFGVAVHQRAQLHERRST